MDINELNSFKLSDAVKFHDKLNPRLWIDKKLDPEVRKQLLVIAEDFMSSLGIGELDIVDITVSGSNAAYSYTPHSDLDLHIVVNIPKLNDTVYRELFTAKKTLYNDSHDITIHGVPVEVYIQDANEPVNSLGEYSVTDDKWIHIPKKKKANFDEAATRAKYENLKDIVDLALNSNSTDRVQKTIDTVRRYRKAGLHKKGEFGPENLAYKAIRSQGGIDALYDKLYQLQGEKLSIEEDISREDAILKIRKLINTTGRSQAEIDNINNIVNQMMKKYNISPAEIDFKPNLATGDKDNDILTKKMAAAAYQKAQAAQGFRDELDKIKAKFKNFFAEDQQLDETVEENQIVNLLSTDIAKKIVDYLTHPKRVKQLNGIKPTEFTAKELNLPTIKDPVIADAISRLSIITGLGPEKLAATYNGNINNPLIGINMRAMFSEPNKFDLSPDVHLAHSIANSLSHELQHLVDGAKSNAKALKYPKNYDRDSMEQYLNLTFEINSRLQQVLHEFYFITRAAKKKDGTPFTKKDLPALIDGLFRHHMLTREYIKDQKVYNRLLTRSYKFLEYLLDNPVKINEPTFMKKAMNFILGKPTSGSIHESSEYDQYENEIEDYIPSENEPIEEIGFADILDNLRLSDSEIISNSIVSGTIGQKPVRVFKHGRNSLYFFSNDTTILALVLLEGSHLKAIKNFTNERGMVYSLLNYIVSFEGKRINIAANEPFTSEGFEWLLRLAKNTHGLRLTTSSGDTVNIDQLKQEWNSARSTKEPGETSLVISEMSGAWKKQLVENENSLMPYRIFEYSDQLSEASGYIPSEKEKNDPRFKTALTVDVRPDSIKKNAKAFNWKTSRAGIPPQARADGKLVSGHKKS